MALQWDWNEKCGEATLIETQKDGTEQEYKINLYKGNAFMIAIFEYVGEDGTEKYQLWSFWADKEHAKNCLGLNKKQGYDSNMYDTPYSRLTRIRLNKDKYPYVKELVPMLAQAFKNITIEIYSEEEQNK